MSSRNRRLVAALTAIGLPAMAAHAQAHWIRTGLIRDSLERVPIPGVYVQLLDPHDSAVTAAISTTDGTFRIASPANDSGPWRLRLRKLGYRQAIVTFGGERAVDSALTLMMIRLPTTLAAVVSTPRSCDDETSARARSLWNDARAAWTADGLSNRDVPITLVREALLPSGWRYPTLPPIRSASAARSLDISRRAFERFLVSHARQVTAASDSESAEGILRDVAFASTHCMRLRRGRDEHRGELAIEFSPGSEHRQPIDLAGTLWVDTIAATPRTLAFEYLTPTVANRRNGGGTITFASTSDGLATVSRWTLHLLPTHDPRPSRTTRVILPTMSLDAIRDTVGDSGLARWDSTTTILGTVPHLLGRVTLRGSDHPFPGVRVSATPTVRLTRDVRLARSRAVITDSLGRFDLELPSTQVRLNAIDTSFADVRPLALGDLPDYDWDIETIRGDDRDAPPPGVLTALHIPFDRDQFATIAVGRGEDALRDACGMKRSGTDLWMLAGRLLPDPVSDDGAGYPPVRARWQEATRDNPTPREVVREQTPDSLGYFRVCKIPRDAAVQLEIVGAGSLPVITNPIGALIVPFVFRPPISKH